MVTNLQAMDAARKVQIADLLKEVKQIKKEIRWLTSRAKKGKEKTSNLHTEDFSYDDLSDEFHEFSTQNQKVFPGESSLQGALHINAIDRVITQKWYVQISILIEDEFSITTEALIDSGADLNCLAKGLIPSKYYSKTVQMLNTADGNTLHIDYKLSDAVVCNN